MQISGERGFQKQEVLGEIACVVCSKNNKEVDVVEQRERNSRHCKRSYRGQKIQDLPGHRKNFSFFL